MIWNIVEFIYAQAADILEILFFSTAIYYLSLWLKKDKQKNLFL
jgi:hypothetical protein